jgi:hypothetical protein
MGRGVVDFPMNSMAWSGDFLNDVRIIKIMI